MHPLVTSLSAIHVQVKELLVYSPGFTVLRPLFLLRRRIDGAIDCAIDQAYRDGRSWGAIGRELVISPQAAQQRHARSAASRSE
jgi:hypothetical protein